MEVTGTATATASGSAGGTGSAGQSTNSSRDEVSSDFQTFLKMLTVQLENQDPLNPVKSEDFAMQLATFSGVEQQVRSNELLESLSAGIDSLGMSQMADWVGMEARVTSEALFDGSEITLYPTARASADRAELVVRDSDGEEVQRVEVMVSSDPITWTGETDDGTLANGSYSFEIESYSGDELLATDAVAHYTEIAEVRGSANGAILVTSAGNEISASEVTGLRQPLADEG